MTLTRARTASVEAANTVTDRILGEDHFPAVLEIIKVEADGVHTALETFRRYSDHELNFTDATIISVCRTRGNDTVLNFDSNFDGLLNRVEPT